MTPSRIRSRRLGAILATALFTVALVPGLATAANTRILWIGAPDLSVDSDGTPPPDNSGTLKVAATSSLPALPTKVSKPDSGQADTATMFQVEILNGGGQNLANTVLTINADAATRPGLALVTSYDPDGGNDADSQFCTTTGDTIVCNYGSLSAGSSRTVAVVVGVSDAYVAPSPAAPLFTASVTTNNENGSNLQTFTADSGSFAVDPFGADSVNTFVLDGVTGENLFTAPVGGGGGDLNTNVKFNTANKELVAINEDTSGDGITGFYACPTGLSCQSLYSEVSTTTGDFNSAPFFTWTLTALVQKTYSLSQGFVAHYPTGAKAFDFTDTTNAYWILYFKSKSSLCPSTDAALATKIASAHQCLYTPTLTKFDKTFNKLTVTVVMDHQGGLKY